MMEDSPSGFKGAGTQCLGITHWVQLQLISVILRDFRDSRRGWTPACSPVHLPPHDAALMSPTLPSLGGKTQEVLLYRRLFFWICRPQAQLRMHRLLPLKTTAWCSVHTHTVPSTRAGLLCSAVKGLFEVHVFVLHDILKRLHPY